MNVCSKNPAYELCTKVYHDPTFPDFGRYGSSVQLGLSEPPLCYCPVVLETRCVCEFSSSVVRWHHKQPCRRASETRKLSVFVHGTTTLCTVTSKRPDSASSGPPSRYSAPGHRWGKKKPTMISADRYFFPQQHFT